MNNEAYVWDTYSAWGWKKKEKFLTTGIRKVFAGERTLAINLELCIGFGCVEFKAGGKTFKSQRLKGQRKELSPRQSPFFSLLQQKVAENENFSIQGTNDVSYKGGGASSS